MTTCFLTEFHLFISSLVSTSLLGFSVVKISLWSSTSGYLIPLGILLSSWLPSRDFTYYFQGISPLPLVQFSLWFYFSLCSQNHIFCFLMWIYLSLSLPEFFKPLAFSQISPGSTGSSISLYEPHSNRQPNMTSNYKGLSVGFSTR